MIIYLTIFNLNLIYQYDYKLIDKYIKSSNQIVSINKKIYNHLENDMKLSFRKLI